MHAEVRLEWWVKRPSDKEMSQFGRAPAAGLTPGRYGSSSAPAKKTITLEEWERMLAAVRVKKEDLVRSTKPQSPSRC